MAAASQIMSALRLSLRLSACMKVLASRIRSLAHRAAGKLSSAVPGPSMPLSRVDGLREGVSVSRWE